MVNRTALLERHLHVEKLEDRRLLAVIADAIAPLGSLIYQEELGDSISVTGETDSFTLDLDAGQTLTAVVDPATGLQAEITVLDPGGIPVGVGTGILGDDVVVQTVPIAAAGTYTVEVSGTASTTGDYALQLLLNAATEDESHGGPLNDTFATAQDIDSSFLSLGFGTAERGAVLGSLPARTSISVASDDFESGSLGGQWTTFSSEPVGRIQVTDAFGAAAGSFALLMDTASNSTETLNESIWTVDLTGVANPILSFSHADFNDEETALPTDFVGSFNGDGVAISDDGLNWHTVTNATDIVPGTWESVAIDLTAEAAAAGMTLGTNFQIKFQQYDNFPLRSDGRGYDDILISASDTSTRDWYRFGLADGQSASLVLTVANTGNGVLDLYASDGTTLLASGGAGDSSQAINNFVDDTADGSNTYYLASVGGFDEQYSLVVTRDADFDTEVNNELGNAQDITLTGTVLGALAGGTPAITTEFEPNDDGVAGGSTGDLPLANDWSGSFLPVGGDQFNATLTGEIRVGNDGDWDFFKILASPGDTLELELRGAPSGQGTLSDPYLRLFDNTGTEIASNDDTFGLESFISFNGFAYAGDYFVVADSYDISTGTYTLIGRHTTPSPLASSGGASFHSFAAVAGDVLTITTATPGSGRFDFVNTVDPEIEILDPSGRPVAHSNVVGNEVFSRTAVLTGIYTVSVFGVASGGESVLNVAGHTGQLPPFEVTSSSPADGDNINVAPTEILVDFSGQLLLPSVDASDLQVNGVDATSVTIIDDDTLQFALPALADGTSNVTIAAGAITDLQNQSLEAFTSQLVIDTVAPRVTSSAIQEGDFVAAGTLIYTARFDEELDASNLDEADVQLVGLFNGSQSPTLFHYDPGTSTLSLVYEDVLEDQYTLTFVSGDGAFEDLAGNDLDGESLNFALPPNVSGDGIEGGDFSLQFFAEASAQPLPVPLIAMDPLGSLVYQGETATAINYSGDVDEYLLALDEGQLITLLVEGDAGLTATVELEPPLLAVTASQTAASAGQPVVIESIPTLNSGTYRIRVSDLSGGIGNYQLTILTNASYEDELFTGVSNNDLASAEDLSLDFLDLGRLNASIAAVLGGGNNGLPEDWFQFDLEDSRSATVVWEGVSVAETAIELYDSAANLLATSVPGVNVAQVIANYLDVTSNGLADSYFVRVAGFVDDYQLIVVRDADFDQELNTGFNAAQDISGTEGALGHIVGTPPAPESGGSSPTSGGRGPSPSAPPPLVNPKELALSDEIREALLRFGGHNPYAPVENSELNDAASEVSVLTAGVPVVSTETSEIPVIQTFAGPGFTGFIPPDPTAAVGPEQVIAMVNTNLAIYEKSTGNLLFQESLNFGSGFFGSVGATDVVFDPWILFDTETDRFFAIAVDVAGSTSDVFLAVSTDATPTDGDDWHKYKIDFTHDPAGTGLGSAAHFPDYPKMGVSSDAIWISANYFPITSGDGVYAGITALEKDPLLSGGAVNVVFEEHFSGFSVMPMQQYGATSTQYFAEASFSGGSTIVIHAISDVLTTPTRTISTIAVPSYAFPLEVPQLDGGSTADSIDNRIMTGIWRDNSMWFAHAALDPVMGDGETLVRWYEVATNGFPSGGAPVLVQAGNVDAGPDVYAWMPAINVDAAGNMGIGFSLGGPNQFFGAGFTGRTVADPLGQTTFPVTEYVVGQENYTDNDGSFRSRWGDYSGLAIDPSDDATFWAFNEYAALGNVWATQFASFQIAEPAAVVDEDWYRFEVSSGDILRIETFTPGEGPFEFLNDLDPSIELYDSAGSLVPHTNGVGNELLFHFAADTGTYRARVFSEDSSKGEYFLQVEGATGGNPSPFVVSSDPADGNPLLNFPTTYTVDFSEPLRLPTIQASDLTVNGTSALAVNVIDGDTLEFEIDLAVNVGDGIYTVEIAAGAVEDLQGIENLLYTGTFEFDTTGPVILSTLWNGLPFRFSRIYEEGALTLEAMFNEDLFVLGSARRGPFAPGVDDVILVENITGTTVAPLTVDFDATTDLLTASFDFVPEGDYLLTLLSGDGSFEDRVGNDFDGEPLGPGLDGTVTGDALNGGNYTVGFSVDSISTDINPFVRLEPLGSFVAESTDNVGFINAAGDQDLFAFFAEGGQNVTTVLTPTDPAATLSLEMLALGSPVVAAGPGRPVVLDSIPLPADATFQLRASGDIPTGYHLDVWLNASAEAAVGDSDVGNELALDNSFLSLGSGRYAVVGHSSVLPPASTLLPNGSFETGDFSAWTMETTGDSFVPWTVGSTGGSGFDMDPVLPQDGLFAAWNGFDGGGPMEFTLYQDVVLPASPSSLDLEWQDRLQWVFFGGLQPRLYDVEIRDPATDAVLDTLYSFSTGTVATAPTGDTGWQTHTADLTAFAGQEVRIYFREQIPEYFTGPAQFELDGVSLLLGAGGSSIDVDRYTIDLSNHVGQSMDFILAGIGPADFSGELLELLDDTGAVVAIASAEPLAVGAAVENYDLGVLDFVVPNIGSNIYTLRLTTSAPGDYGVLITDDLIFDTGANNSTSSPVRNLDDIDTALGFLQQETTVLGVVEPDDFLVGTNLATAVPGVTLSVIGGGTITSQFSAFPSTGSNVFGNDIFGPGWGEFSAELRADFDAATDSVSIAAGSDDPSDQSFLRAFDASDNLLEEVLSSFLAAGQSQTLTISRSTADIAYVTASGTGVDVTILDRLEFAPRDPTLSGDLYTVHLAAGQTLTAFSEIPLFVHPLSVPFNDLDPELTFSAIDGTVLATDADSLDGRNARFEITAAIAGDYHIRIRSTSGEGEYLLHVEEGLLPADFDSSGGVTGFDFLAWQRGFGKTSGATRIDGDGDGDGDVDGQDLSVWGASFGEGSSASEGSTLPPDPSSADFDNSGAVNGNDFLAWQLGFGTASESANGNGDSDGDGDVDAQDLTAWEASFGEGSSNRPSAPLAAATSASPETLVYGVVETFEPVAAVDRTESADGQGDAFWAAVAGFSSTSGKNVFSLGAATEAALQLVEHVDDVSVRIRQSTDVTIRDSAIEQLAATGMYAQRVDFLWDGEPAEKVTEADWEDTLVSAAIGEFEWL